jgi:tRNA pseudouridine38-40 synthase
MPVYRLTIEYDGTKFRGWQAQREGRTVQGVLSAELADAIGDAELTVRGAGRTDAGVHALAQVASLSCRRPIDCGLVLRRLEERLPADLAVLDLCEAPPRFHPRHDAMLRSYRYQISRRRSAFGKRFTWWVRDDLDLEAMRGAAESFIGRHDFRRLSRRDEGDRSTIVVVDQVRLVEAGDLVLLRVVASHFLWGQVRRMTGALVAVGAGRARREDVPGWLDGTVAPPELTAPAAGLFLEAVRYPGEDPQLPPLAPVGVPLSGGAGEGAAPRATRTAVPGRKR